MVLKALEPAIDLALDYLEVVQTNATSAKAGVSELKSQAMLKPPVQNVDRALWRAALEAAAGFTPVTAALSRIY